MIEPTKILRFLENNFDSIKTLYKLHKDNGAILYHQIEVIFNSEDMINKVIEYLIVEERIDGTYILREIYFDFISGLLDDYSLDMPEQISKYHSSLSELYVKLKSFNSKNEAIRTLEALEKEILKFESQLKRNIKKLIEETKYIKANNDKLSYPQKVQKASELSTIYLKPLNIILSDHSDSIFNIINNVIEESNYQRFANDDENLKVLFLRIYNSYTQVKKEILNENRLLINEVAPLLERIKTESQILTGCINYLSDPSKYDAPIILDKKASSTTYNIDNLYYDARDIWDGYFDTIEDVVINEIEEVEYSWLYDEDKYTNLFIKSLPNTNYYKWVYETLQKELEIVNIDHFLQLSKIIIMTDNIEAIYTEKREDLYLEDKIFNVPLVQIKESINEQYT